MMDKVGKTVSSAKAAKTLARALKVVKAQQETITDLQASMRDMEKKMSRQTKQIAAASADMNRRSLDPSTLGTYGEGGHQRQ